MKKSISSLLIALSALIILDTLNAGEALFMFLLAGVIPGTTLSISGATMLALFVGIGGFILARLVTRAVNSLKQPRQVA